MSERLFLKGGKSIILGHSDVVVMNDRQRITSKTARTCEVLGEVMNRMRRTDRSSGGTNIINDPDFFKWVGEGIEAEVMTGVTSGWLKGKVRLRLEFILDPEIEFELEPEPEPEPEPEEKLMSKEPEPLLDEFRQEENESDENAQLKQLESLLDKIRQQD